MTQFTSWGISRAKVLELAELAADKDPKMQAWLDEYNCASEYLKRRSSYEYYCREVGLPVTSFLGSILRELENQKITETRAKLIAAAPDVADNMVLYATTPKGSVDRANVMKAVGVLKESNVNVQVNNQVNTAVALNIPDPDAGIIKRFEMLKED